MNETENDKIRRSILEIFYESALKNPTSCAVTREMLKTRLLISDNLIDMNVMYLHGKKLVRICKWKTHELWEAAVLDIKGVDVVEHKEQYANEFPFMQLNLQNINGIVFGNAIQAVNSQVAFDQKIVDAFKQIYVSLDSNSSLTQEGKDQTRSHLKTIEEELLSKGSLDKIRKSLNWLKQNASWVVPTVTQVIIEGLKALLM